MAHPAAASFPYLVALKAELQATFHGQDEQIREARRVREMERPALEGCDDKYRLVEVDPRDPAVADESFRVQAANSLSRPVLSLEHRESDTAETNATLRKQFTEQCFWTIGTRGQGQDTMRDIMDSTLNDGGGWAKLLYAKDVWSIRNQLARKGPGDTSQLALDDYNQGLDDAAKTAGPPMYWAAIDPLTIYPQWGPDGDLIEVLEVQELPLHRAMRDYRLTINDSGQLVPDPTGYGMPTSLDQIRGLPHHVTRLEHWDRKYCTYSIMSTDYYGDPTGLIVPGRNGQFVHGYEFGLPYDFAPGLWMSHWKNRKVGWGIAQTKTWLVAYRSYLRAMHAQYVARDLLTPLVDTVPDGAAPILGENGEPLRREDGPQPGEILVGRPGETVVPVQYPDSSTLEKHILMIDQAIERLESPRVTTLEGLEGAGFAISQVLEFDLIRFGTVRQNIETLLTRQTNKMWSLIKSKINTTVYVESATASGGYLGIGPDDLQAPVGIAWSITPQRAADTLVRSRAAHERLQAGTLDKDSVVEYLAGRDEAWNKSPDEIRRGLARDQIRMSPEYQAWQKNVVLQYAGRGDLLTQAGDAERAAMQGMLPGNPGQPGLAGVPNAMGSGIIPDIGNLAMAPNGRGAVPGNGNLGTGPGVVMPQNGTAAGAQPLTP